MGHIHLGTLQKTKTWVKVVDLLKSGDALSSVVAESARAAEHDLQQATGQPVFVEAVRLLLSIPLAARQTDFLGALRSVGVAVDPNPTLFDIVTAAVAQLDVVGRGQSQRNDSADIATRALSQALMSCVGSDLPGLFSPTAEDVRLSIRKFSYSTGIAQLCRSFFGSVVGSSLSYWLDRVLAQQIGTGLRFKSIVDRSEFDRDLNQYTHEVTRIIREFAGGWYGKTVHDKAGIHEADARVFAYVCTKKMIDELKLRRGLDD